MAPIECLKSLGYDDSPDLPVLTGGSGVGLSSLRDTSHCLSLSFSFLDFSALQLLIFLFLPAPHHDRSSSVSDSGSRGGQGCKTRQEQGKLLRKHWPPGLRVRVRIPSQTGDSKHKSAVCWVQGVGKNIFYH